MTALNDDIFKGTKDPDPELIKTWRINGGVDVIQQKLKLAGWDEKTPVASLVLHQNDEGRITSSQLVVSGFKEVGKIMANVIYGDSFKDKQDYVKINPVDLSQANIRGRMASDWMSSDKQDWVLKIHNPDSGRFRMVDKLNQVALEEKGATKMSFKLLVNLSKGPKLNGTLGLAPHSNISSLVGNGAMNFPIIKAGKDVKIDFMPPEPEGVEWGLAMIPFILHTGDPDAPFPTIENIRVAQEDLFNNACKPKVHTKFHTWKDSAALGTWDQVDTDFYWPSHNKDVIQEQEDAEEGETSQSCHRSFLISLSSSVFPWPKNIVAIPKKYSNRFQN